MHPERFTNVEKARARFGDRVDRLAPYLFKVDTLADAVVETIEKMPAKGWAMFSQAAARGIATVDGAPDSFRAFFDQTERVPVWVDWDAIDRGGDALFKAGPLGGIVLGVKSLVLGYASRGGNKPLVFSGRLAEQAGRRLNETARFVQATCQRGGLRKFNDGYQITLKVRLIHAQVRRMILRSERWQPEKWGAPVNQHDMVGTSLLFSIILLEGLRQLGVTVPWREGERYIQLWRYSGYLSGIEPELLPASEVEARRLGELIEATMGEPDDDSRRLTKALLDSSLADAKTPAEYKNALRLRRFANAMCRALIGDELADKLGVEQTSWRYLVPFIRRFVSSAELIRASVPLGLADVPALWVGTRYWGRVIEVGLAGAIAEFGLPEKLGAAAA
jgi:hypothetical protein